MNIEISSASFAEKSILRNLMQLYLYDFSPIDGADVDKFGLYGYRILDQYWVESGRFPFLMRGDGQLVGFALLRRGTYFDEHAAPKNRGMTVAEFFVMRKYRRQGMGKRTAFHLFDLYRQGVGKRTAFHLFDLYPGRWEVAQLSSNSPAQDFWRKVINEYTGGYYTDHLLDSETWQGPVQVFNNALANSE
jgi:predicted acetyltransferase